MSDDGLAFLTMSNTTFRELWVDSEAFAIPEPEHSRLHHLVRALIPSMSQYGTAILHAETVFPGRTLKACHICITPPTRSVRTAGVLLSRGISVVVNRNSMQDNEVLYSFEDLIRGPPILSQDHPWAWKKEIYIVDRNLRNDLPGECSFCFKSFKNGAHDVRDECYFYYWVRCNTVTI